MEKLEFLKHNRLFHGLTESQLLEISPIVQVLSFKTGDLIIHENEVNDTIYIIENGEVEIRKEAIKHGTSFRIAVLKAGDIVGEITLLDNAPRSASVHALTDCVLYAISAHELRAVSQEKLPSKIIAEKLTKLAQEAVGIAAEPIYAKLVQNLAKNLGQRVRVTSDTVVESLGNELELTKARATMGFLIIVTLCMLSFYILVLKVILSIPGAFWVSTTILSGPILAIFAIGVFIYMIKSRYPLRTFGLTMKNWRYNSIEAIFFSLPFLPLTMLLKWVVIQTTTGFANRPIFDMSTHTEGNSWALSIAFFALYMFFVPLQELIVRGALQSSFRELLVTPHKTLYSILLSNLLFSVTHFHFSLLIGLIIVIPGFFWGWLYARQGSLVGVIVSHWLIGIWALFVVGFY